MHPYAFRLDFQCTNNEVEYEALIQGIEIARDLGIGNLIVMGDFEFVVNHVRNKYQVKKCKLKAYLQRVRTLIDSFLAFNITFIHRDKNHRAYYLVVSASMFNQNDLSFSYPFKVGVLFKLAVPNNEESWQVFDNDEHIAIFFEVQGINDEESHKKGNQNQNFDQQGILNINSNYVPKGLIELKSLFTGNDKVKSDSMSEKESQRTFQEMKKINIGTPENPKLLNLCVTSTDEETREFIKLFQEFQDISHGLTMI